MLDQLKKTLRQEIFLPSRLGIVINPLYILRRGLYKGIVDIAPKIKGDVLDFGCGSKPYESLFINAHSYTGVDLAASGHDHKNSKVDVFYNGITLPFPENHFDAVVSFEVLEHLFNIEEILVEIKRVLKPYGQILITVPFAYDEHEIPYDFARYTSYGIKYILQKNEIDIVGVYKTTSYVLAVCQMLIAYLARYISPRSRMLSRLFQMIIIFPLNVMSILLDCILPKRYDYFCNSVVVGINMKEKAKVCGAEEYRIIEESE
jgi:SAM-dependent methyltransferase